MENWQRIQKLVSCSFRWPHVDQGFCIKGAFSNGVDVRSRGFPDCEALYMHFVVTVQFQLGGPSIA
jgi:hypothetical protein